MNIQKSILALASSPAQIVYFDGQQEISEDYASLFKRSLFLLGGLQAGGVGAGDILLLDLSGAYAQITCFWACLLGGIVPALLPDKMSAPGIRQIAKGLPRPTLLSTRGLACEELPQLDYGSITRKSPGQIVRRRDHDPGMIQLTSGSTGKRRNVLLSLKNLWVGGLASSVVVRPGVVERYLNWLPLSHCFGFVGYHLVPLVKGFPQYHLDTAAFVKNPALWLQKLSDFRATMTGAARFGLRLVTNKAAQLPAPENDLDLSSLYICFCGGEDLLAEELRLFERTLAPFGLLGDTLKPAYGLSETTMGVAYTPPGESLKTEKLDPAAVVLGKPLVFRPGADCLERLSVGVLDQCNAVQIRDGEGKPLADGCLGEVHIAGDNLMSGYLQPDGSLQHARDRQGYFKTGDLGFFHGGRLCLYGRLKDILIINGKNINRLDLEKIAREALGQRGDLALAQQRLTGELVLLGSGLSTQELKEAARAITKKRGITVAAVVSLVQMPRTETGKLDRLSLEKGLEQDLYSPIPLKPETPALTAATLDSGEGRLAELWSVVLEIDKTEISKASDFFTDLGGCSLTSMDLISQIEAEYGLVISRETLQTYSALGELAALLHSLKDNSITL